MNRFTLFMQKANYLMFLVLVAALPLPRTIVQWCWILWAVTWLLELRFLKKENLQWGKQMIPSLFLLGWVLWECISLIWGKGFGDGGRFPDFHASLFFFPIICLYGLNERYDWKKICKVFIISCVSSFFLYSWLLYWMGNYEFVLFRNGDGPLLPFQLSYFDIILSPIKHRMIYCSCLGLAIILLLLIRRDILTDWGRKRGMVFIIGSLVVLTTAILATGSRANLLTLVSIGCIAWIAQVKRYRPVLITFIVLIAIGSCLAIWKFHPRMKTLTIEQVTHIQDHYNDPDMQPRLIIWQLALQNPKDYLLRGIGTGNVQSYLGEKYEQVGLPYFKDSGYAAHNQYLYVCIELGIFAMVLFFLFWYGIPLCFPKGSRARAFALYFVLFFGINMLTDDNLSRIEPIIYTCVCLLMMMLMAKTEKATALEHKLPQ